MLLAAFATIFDLFVVNIALPTMRTEFAASQAAVGYIVASYELAFGIGVVTGGRLGDLFGRRRTFTAGVLGFTLASTVCGLAPDVEILIAARLFQGGAAALVLPQVYASIRANFSGSESSRAFGILGMALGLAAIAGQVFGGWLVEADLLGSSWRSIFLINLPLGAAVLVLARTIPESRAAKRSSLDGAGVVIVTMALALLLVPLLEASSGGWTLPSLLSLSASAVLFVLFVRHQERRRLAGRDPLIDMRLLARVDFAAGTAVILLVFSAASAFFLSFAFLAQTGFGLSPVQAGSLFAPCSAGFVVASLIAPRLVARQGLSAIAWGAVLYAGAIGVLVVQMDLGAGATTALELIPALFLVGAGQGIVHTQILNLLLSLVEQALAGMASGIVSTGQQVGAALGAAIAGLFLSGVAATETTGFVRIMLWNGGSIALSAIILFGLSRRARSSCFTTKSDGDD